MTQFPRPEQSVFWFSFESLTDDNKWKDSGPNGLHATLQAGFSAPAYGLAKNNKGKGYVNFTGAATVRASLPFSFYQHAPTTDFTIVVSAQHTNPPVLNSRIFTVQGAALGFFVYFNATTTLNVNCTSGAGSQWFDTSSVNFYTKTTSIYSVSRLSGTGRIWHDRNQSAGTWAGATTSLLYDASIVPMIGGTIAEQNFSGRMYHLSLFPFVFTDSEAKTMSDYLRDLV